MEFIHKHPKLSLALGGVSALVLVLYMAGGSGGANTPSSDTAALSQYDQAALQSSTDLQEAQIAAQGQDAQYQAAFQATQDQDQTQVALANINAQLGSQQISATQESQDLANTLGAQLGVAQLNTQEQIAALGASVQQGQITAEQNIAENTNATTLAVQQSNNQTMIGLGQIQAGQAESLAQTYAGATVALGAQNEAVQLQNAKNNAPGFFSQIFG